MSYETASTTGGRSWWLWAGLGDLVVSGGVAGGVIVAATRPSSPSHTCSATSVANKGLPSVVTISVTSGTGGGTGSGEFIRSSGEILTNNHVIAAAAHGADTREVLCRTRRLWLSLECC
jgi:putative serine protease PepD